MYFENDSGSHEEIPTSLPHEELEGRKELGSKELTASWH